MKLIRVSFGCVIANSSDISSNTWRAPADWPRFHLSTFDSCRILECWKHEVRLISVWWYRTPVYPIANKELGDLNRSYGFLRHGARMRCGQSLARKGVCGATWVYRCSAWKQDSVKCWSTMLAAWKGSSFFVQKARISQKEFHHPNFPAGKLFVPMGGYG